MGVKTYLMSAVLKRTVLDTLSLKVRASNLEHAYEIVKQHITDYPDNTNAYGQSVPFMVVEDRKTLSSDILDLEHEDVEPN